MRKLIDKESIGRMNVLQLTAYLRLPLERYVTAMEATRLMGQTHQIVYRYLLTWSEAGLVEKAEYDGTAQRVRLQYRRLYNKVTVVKEGVLFEIVKEG